MNFLSTALSVFITNYIIMIVVKYIPVRNKRFWQIIIISIYCAVTISISAYYYVKIILTYPIQIEYTSYQLLSIIVGVAIGYVLIMIIILDGNSIFKNRRYREFEKAFSNTESRNISKNVIALILIFVSLFLMAYLIYLLINFNSKQLADIIGISILIALFIIGGIILFFKKSKIKTTEKIIFFIISKKKNYVFIENNSKKSINELIGDIDKLYLVDDYGYLYLKKSKMHIFGIKNENFDINLINKVLMNQTSFSLFNKVVELLDKFNRKKIYIDEDYKIIKEEKI